MRGGDKEHVQIIQGVVVMADNIEKVEEDVRRTNNEVQKKTQLFIQQNSTIYQSSRSKTCSYKRSDAITTL